MLIFFFLQILVAKYDVLLFLFFSQRYLIRAGWVSLNTNQFLVFIPTISSTTKDWRTFVSITLLGSTAHLAFQASINPTRWWAPWELSTYLTALWVFRSFSTLQERRRMVTECMLLTIMVHPFLSSRSRHSQLQRPWIQVPFSFLLFWTF
jgi:hypothetical protein